MDFGFEREWTAQVLNGPPLIAPMRQYIYPKSVEDIERGALLVDVRPRVGGNFLATCALGFADPAAANGLWSCPNPREICAAAGGYVYVIDTTEPTRWQQIPQRPVLEVRALHAERLLVFAGFHTLTAWGVDGRAWESARVSWEGIKITSVGDGVLHGVGWDLPTDEDVPLQIDLKTGEHTGGAGPKRS